MGRAISGVRISVAVQDLQRSTIARVPREFFRIRDQSLRGLVRAVVGSTLGLAWWQICVYLFREIEKATRQVNAGRALN